MMSMEILHTYSCYNGSHDTYLHGEFLASFSASFWFFYVPQLVNVLTHSCCSLQCCVHAAVIIRAASRKRKLSTVEHLATKEPDISTKIQ